jgi:anti-sigma factor ChrR (cupin superfamily)
MLNMDFSQRVVIDSTAVDWVASPKAGVWRKPLAREEAEQGHATSIVRYDPGASFPEHNHPGGEEILVLEGTFSDQTGDYCKGSYFRNPIGFRHAPFSKDGCVLLVKLHQFQPGDEQHVQVDTNTIEWQPGSGKIQLIPLHDFGSERVALFKWSAEEKVPLHSHPAGEEVYVIQGEIADEQGQYRAGTWLRCPHGSAHAPHAVVDSLLWVKTGHLCAGH